MIESPHSRLDACSAVRSYRERIFSKTETTIPNQNTVLKIIMVLTLPCNNVAPSAYLSDNSCVGSLASASVLSQGVFNVRGKEL